MSIITSPADAAIRWPDVTILALNGKTPRIHESAFIAPGCRIIGDVEIGPQASIWYNCVLRADINYIRVGARSNIQDLSMVHVETDYGDGGHPAIIGEDVLIGHMALVHGCILHDRAFVGMGAIVMDGCEIEGDAMLAAGAMLTPKKKMPARQLWSGRPAKFMRDLSDADIVGMQRGVKGYVQEGAEHAGALRGLSAHD
ncbi:gamma carbonic anhydrase family protein [Sphingobium nicotianae]|uniref:Gamma carbonic anhydrase family protein n=1 Tax=Sphingobium nicotianae TaxID=2782607 RepID=A0A9X1DF59_9SPHN|nr:gamma carbonic anhydrase family protein [Sphingobium nicotianae]MBT2188768.1 gamma carbonic anhydrase family protein [Sphingobium nicotianae]